MSTGADIAIDPTGDEPPFEQIRRQIAARAADATYPAGHRLPTVRGLAETLGLAPNTVAKAYRALETDGVIQTRGRAGTLIAARTAPDDTTDRSAQTLVLNARRQGLTKDEAIRLIERYWA